MTWFGRVLKAKAVDTMLDDVRECYQASLSSDNAPRVLDTWVVVLDIPQPGVILLVVGDFFEVVRTDHVSEGKG